MMKFKVFSVIVFLIGFVTAFVAILGLAMFYPELRFLAEIVGAVTLVFVVTSILEEIRSRNSGTTGKKGSSNPH